jgi:hypothetical protein
MITNESILETRAMVLLEHLEKSRQLGRTSQEKPIPASKLCTIYNAKPYEWHTDGGEIRQMVHWLRERGHDIGSNGKGYWFIIRPEEYDEVIAHQLSRIREQTEVMRIAKERQEVLRKRYDDLFKVNPVLGDLANEFGAYPKDLP